MLNNIIKISFTLVGAVTGVTLTKTIFSVEKVELPFNVRLVIYAVAAAIVALLFYVTAAKVIELITGGLDKVELALQKATLYELTVIAGGLTAGLVVANLIAIPISRLVIIGVPLAIMVNILCGSMGIAIAASKKNEAWSGLKGHKGFNKGGRIKMLDTSAIIDGRIVDICRTGFMEGELVIPAFVLEELRHIADCSDVLKRNRGRRGLDVLNVLQKELEYPVKVENIDVSEATEVDDKLLKAAAKIGAEILTNDYNLNKVASLHGVTVLNINELANALKPIAIPGEEMQVQVIKDGKENGQGIGYLDDGTMVVVEGGKRHMGEPVSVIVTSVLQTAAGRMIFAKPKCPIERVI